MARTTSGQVAAVLVDSSLSSNGQGDYDGTTDLTPYIDAACKKCSYKMLPAAGWVPIERAYKVGDVIETTQDLDKLNGFVQDPNSLQKIKVGKFMPLHEDGQTAQSYPAMPAKARVVDIGEMSLDELRQFSEEEELGVDFDKLKTADDARKAVRAARKVATQ